MNVTVVGAGPGSPELFTGKMKKAVSEADLVLTSERLVHDMKLLNVNAKACGIKETLEYIDEKADSEERLCVVASGDTGFYSIASTIARQAGKGVTVERICGISSMQYFAAVTDHGYETMKLVSLHGRGSSIVPFVCYNKSVFALTGGALKASDIVRELADKEMDHVQVFIGENLTMESERIVQGKPSELAQLEFDDLAVMIVDNPEAADSNMVLRDEDFIRGKVPMTKETIRCIAAAELAIKPGDVVYDVGAGTGAMTCTMALAANESFVYALEKKAEAVELVHANMKNLGIYNIDLKSGSAPEAMEGFPPADKVFIGGSCGNLREIVERVLAANEAAVIVITAVTLETLSEAQVLFKSLELKTDIKCINISKAEKLGRYDLMKAENPIYILRGEKDD